MDEPNWSPSTTVASSSSYREDSGAMVAASSSGVSEEEEDRDRDYPPQNHFQFHSPELGNRCIGGFLSYKDNSPAFNDNSPPVIRDDMWSCIIYLRLNKETTVVMFTGKRGRRKRKKKEMEMENKREICGKKKR
ncbi:hypothetical protein Gorai_012357 [Gossypium raimondii]|uniref:Uncharacterized protein n=1 Tax=Gossypium raimondii TaxID=29730 RepID=A0A0D2UR88_GOSRA|nr:hypothetical protein B456_009G209100 [Gossypium raimondii]MBA0595489.1 hypothetical protein [Gossypium raimondii]